MKARTGSWIVFLAVACCTMIVGCMEGVDRGGGGTPVTGVLQEGGQPVAFEATEEGGEDGYVVRFYPLDESGNLAQAQTYESKVDASGKFTILDPMGRDIPAGKYRVGVALMKTESGDQKDALGGKFGRTVSPFEFEVKPGDNITIELEGAEPTGEIPKET